jgi:hypothetical protein
MVRISSNVLPSGLLSAWRIRTAIRLTCSFDWHLYIVNFSKEASVSFCVVMNAETGAHLNCSRYIPHAIVLVLENNESVLNLCNVASASLGILMSSWKQFWVELTMRAEKNYQPQ